MHRRIRQLAFTSGVNILEPKFGTNGVCRSPFRLTYITQTEDPILLDYKMRDFDGASGESFRTNRE